MTSALTKRPLVIAVLAALFLGFILLAPFFSLIVLSAIAAYIFYPVHQWLVRHLKREGLSAALTVVLTLLAVIIPVIFVSLVTFSELKTAANNLSTFAASNDIGEIGGNTLERVNTVLDSATAGSVQLDIEGVKSFVASNAAKFADTVIGFLTSSIGGVGAFFAAFVIYLYVFTSLLTNHRTLIRTFKGLNPLGDKVSDMYLSQAGAMTKAMVRGQFIIASLQGITGALSLYIAGIDLFWLFVLLLTVLSIIPLGGGIVTVPIGIALLLTGNIWQGVFVLLIHFLVVTNIDNVLRPRLVPKQARLNSALTILSVFAGISMFGLLGIVIGPVMMILIVSTVRVYLEEVQPTKRSARPSGA